MLNIEKKVKLELIPDPDMYIFFEKLTRERVSYISNRYSKGTSKANKYTSNNSKGCVLEVDLEYLKFIRELHNDYALAPDKIEIQREILSDQTTN